MQMAQPKVLLHPPACKPYGLEADISLLRYLSVPLNLYLRNLRCRRILAHDSLRGVGSPLRAGGREADLFAPLFEPHIFPLQCPTIIRERV